MNATAVTLVERLGIALLHSLWQGSLVGLGLLAVLVALRHARSQLRYLICCLALLLMLLAPASTFLALRNDSGVTSDAVAGERKLSDSRLVASAAAALEAAASLLPEELPPAVEHSPSPAVDGQDFTAPAIEAEAQGTADREQRWLSPHAQALLLAIVAGWCVGVVLISCRLLGGYLAAWRLTLRRIEPLDEIWQARFVQLAVRLRARLPIELWQSACVEVPAVVGCLRPVVLLPAGMLTGLPVAQIEAILAHELAHICRYDFLVNAVQCIAETLLFYHPCAWWISARIRAEREQCCDEMAVAACGDALIYARALTGLEELRSPARLALALTGGGSLLSRIRRLVGQRRASDVVGGWLSGTLAIALPLAVGGTWAWGRAVHDDAGRADIKLVDRANADSEVGENAAAFARYDAIFRDAVGVTNDLAQALSTVSDARSGATVAETIVKLSRRKADVDRKLRELRRSISPELEQQLARRWSGQIEDSAVQLGAEVARVAKLPGAADALRSSVLFEVIGLHDDGTARPDDMAMVDFIAPFGPPFGVSRGERLKRMVEQHGEQRMVKVVVAGLPGNIYNHVYERLRQILPNLSYFGTGKGDIATVHLAPVSDLEFFAANIDLGEVTSIDRVNRVITVVAERARFPQVTDRAAASDQQRAADRQEPDDLASLCERLARRDVRAREELIALDSAAESAVGEYVGHADRRVRREALLVLKKIGTEMSLAALLPALADPDVGNRDLAWQTICHIPGLMKRAEVIEATAAALTHDGAQASKWLTAIGPPAEQVVLSYIQDHDGSIRLQAVRVLNEIGTSASLAALEPMVDDNVDSVAAAANAACEAIRRRQGR